MGDHGGLGPHEAQDAAAFVASLRRLKEASGLTYRQLEARAAERGEVLSHSTLAGALNRVSLPRAELVSAFVRACGCSAEERGAWLAARRQLSAGRAASRARTGTPAPRITPSGHSLDPHPLDQHPYDAPRAPVTPAQLPAGSSAFTGRQAELAELLSLSPDHDSAALVIAAIDGMAGVGKTALAVHAAHRLASAFPDGQLFIDLHGCTQGVEPLDPAVALEGVLRAAGIPGERIPSRLDERAALYRSRLAGTRMLIVLDNAISESQATPLLPAAPGSMVVITSRRRLLGITDARHLSLDVLLPADAIALFTHSIGATRLAAEPPERLTEVVELCGRLPLALRIAAARLNARQAWTLADLAERLVHHGRSVEPQDARRSVNAALDLSYRHLTSEQRRVYRLLSLQPGVDVDAHAASALADAAVPQTVRLLDDLVDSHLLTEPLPGRYRFHDLVRVHAASAAATETIEAERHAALHRLFGHYAHTASIAMDAVYPYETDERPDTPPASGPVPDFDTAEQADNWLNDELENVLAAAHAAAHCEPHHTLHQSAVLHRHLRARGRYGDAIALHESAMDVASTPAAAPGTLN
ncbi:ATP-binding protein, partial [Streptomyces umbrinus]